MGTDRLNCQKCKYYFITWDNRYPYGCRLFGVKSREAPSIIVYQSLGKQCEGFLEKEKQG